MNNFKGTSIVVDAVSRKETNPPWDGSDAQRPRATAEPDNGGQTAIQGRETGSIPVVSTVTMEMWIAARDAPEYLDHYEKYSPGFGRRTDGRVEEGD